MLPMAVQELLRKIFLVGGNLLCMYAFYLLIKYLTTGISKDFGEGFFSGMFVLFTVFYFGGYIRTNRTKDSESHTDYSES
jgi:hypothetical protein